jgi:hypothetical protein
MLKTEVKELLPGIPLGMSAILGSMRITGYPVWGLAPTPGPSIQKMFLLVTMAAFLLKHTNSGFPQNPLDELHN